MNKVKKWLIPVAVVCLLLAALVGCSNAPASLGETFDPSGNPFVHRFSDVTDLRTATFVVAASDSEHKYEADYFCDGTNDQVQIQAAIDALPATGGEVFLLDGTYNVEVALALDSYQTLRGCGRNTILTTTTATLDIIMATGGSETEKLGILIADLCVDGDAGGATSHTGIKWAYVDYSKISNTWIVDNGEHGIFLDFSDFNEIVGNYVLDSTLSGIRLQDAHKNTVAANIAEGNDYGIDLTTMSSTCGENIVAGNTCQGNDTAGISLYEANDCTVSGNTCLGNTTYGIALSVAYRDTITGNIIQGNTLDGIYSWSEAFDCVISSNVIRLNGHHGIYLCGGHNNVIGNLLLENSQTTDAAYDNIFVEDSGYNLISGNICRRGGETNKPRYGINISNDGCDRNCLIGNDLYDSGSTGDLNDVPTTNPTLKHDNRDMAGTGWLPEV